MPGQNVGYRYSSLNNETAKFFTYVIIVLNIVIGVLGGLMITCGIYILCNENIRDWVSSLNMQFYYTGVYILLAAGVLVMLISFFGCCGAYQKKRALLVVYSVGLVICFVLELSGAIYTLSNGITNSQMEPWLNDKFLSLISQINYDENAKRTMSKVEEWVGCCGANGVQDYIAWNIVVPYTCFDPVNGNAWYRDGIGYVGCVGGFSLELQKWSGWISGLALTIAFFQMFTFGAAVLLACAKHEFKSQLNLNRY